MKQHDDILTEVESFCSHHRLLPDGGLIVVGLSGGPDSTALIDLLLRLAPRHHLTIAAAHLHHGLRGHEADRDEHAVRDFCVARGVQLFVRRLDIRTMAQTSGQTVEETGRNARYAFFREIARQMLDERRPDGFPDIGASVCHCEFLPFSETDDIVRVAVGHHQDDQAETVLLNLNRGSGLSGLVGMLPKNGLIIRPLLEISRERIDRYVRMRDLPTCQDLTNAQPGATRNRLRLEILPALRETFGTDTSPAIARAAGLLRVDADFLNGEAARQLDLCGLSGTEASDRPGEGRALSITRLNRLHPAIRTRVLRLWFQNSFGDIRDLSEKHVASMESLCREGRSGHHRSLPGGRRVTRVFDSLILKSAQDMMGSSAGTDGCPGEPVPLAIPGETRLPRSRDFFITRFVENEQQIIYNNQIWCFSVTELAGAVVRHRQAGDHIRPDGKSHGRSLKKYLTEKRVPAADRDSLSMIAVDSEILWIPGVTAAGFLNRPDPKALDPGTWVTVTHCRE